jgi:hypothetical protein
VEVKLAEITAVRIPLQGEYPAGVNAVISVGRMNQAVRESYDTVKSAMLEHGALGQPASGQASRFAALLAANYVRHITPKVRHGGNDRNDHQHSGGAHHRVHGEYRLADSGAIHLHPISHHGRS